MAACRTISMFYKSRFALAGFIGFAVVMICCISAVYGRELSLLSPKQYPVFSDDLGYQSFGRAIDQSIAYYEKLPGLRKIAYGPDTYLVRDLISGLGGFKKFIEKKPSSDEMGAFLGENARVYAYMQQGKPVSVLFTGYYEPVLEGSSKRTDLFKYPVYARPRDLLKVDLSAFDAGCARRFIIGRQKDDRLVPYYDRQTIETTEAMAENAEVLAWVADPVKLFFLHVQGSGRIALQDGSLIYAQFDITNGHPYRSIGKFLIDQGLIERQDMSMQAIVRYLEKHPGRVRETFFYNPRYVFFRQGKQGPSGSLGVGLTPGRSAALDPKTSPAGALLFVSTQKPVCEKPGIIDRWVSFARFMCCQDTGSAISGEKRADLFWGSGIFAETAAGHMQHNGKLYYIVVLPEAFDW